MKLLIVEDETLTRDGLITSVLWFRLGICAVYQACDGIHGIRLAREIRPEIILCDIRMPRMDGIKMARKLHQELPDSEIIFMSGYTDKEYLKAAIRLKAIRYIEKPLNIAEICDAVGEAAASWQKRQLAIRRDTDLCRQNTYKLAQLLTFPKQQHHTAIIPLWTSLGLPDITRTAVTTCLVKFELNHILSDELVDTLAGEINRFLKSYGLFTLISHRYQKFLVIHICGNRTLPNRDREEILAFLAALLEHQSNFYLTCGPSTAEIAQAYSSYETSVYLMESSFFFRPNTILTPDNLPSAKTVMPDSPAELIRLFFDALSLKEETSCLAHLEKIYDYYYQNTCALSDQAKEIYYKLFTGLDDYRPKLKLPRSPLPEQAEKTVIRYLDSFFSLDALHREVSKRTTQFFAELTLQNEDSPITFIIKSYIHDHYANELLSVKDISGHVHLSTSYLCTLFKAETKKTLNQYLTEYRIERAKKLLTDSHCKITEISAMVGYSDSNYFGKSFKKTVGVSPTEFRERRMI